MFPALAPQPNVFGGLQLEGFGGLECYIYIYIYRRSTKPQNNERPSGVANLEASTRQTRADGMQSREEAGTRLS